MKPTGVQEDYLAKLLARVADPEMKQIIEKKLYQAKANSLSEQKLGEEVMTSAIAEIIKNQEFVVTPTYDLPEEYRVPNLSSQIEEALETDTDNGFDRKQEDLFSNGVRNPESGKEDSEEGEEAPEPPKGCRVCSGYHLEPMVSPPSLHHLVSDCLWNNRMDHSSCN